MLNINRADVNQMVKIIEYITENEEKVSVDKLLADCGLTFDEYRLMSALSMPTIRKKNDMRAWRSKAYVYKKLYDSEKQEREKLDELLDELLLMAKGYLDKRYKEEKKNESNVYTVARSEGEDAVQASGTDNDGAEGHPEEWAI